MTPFQECLKMAAVTAAMIFTCIAIAMAVHRYDMKKLKERREREEKHRAEMAGKTINIIRYKDRKSPRKR